MLRVVTICDHMLPLCLLPFKSLRPVRAPFCLWIAVFEDPPGSALCPRVCLVMLSSLLPRAVEPTPGAPHPVCEARGVERLSYGHSLLGSGVALGQSPPLFGHFSGL